MSIPVTRSSMPSFEEYVEMIRPIWESRWLTNMGSLHQQLEKELTQYLGVPGVSLFSNGHLALENAITCMNLTGSVITTPYTFASTTQAIVRCGLRPIFCDINPVDFTIDADQIESLIEEDTTAIVAVHVYGKLCHVEKIEEIARRHNLKVIYDAAHAFGVSKNGVGAGAFGDASMFSFHATKVFHTIEGGCVTCATPEIYQKLAIQKNFGQSSPEHVVEVAGNAKMSEFNAAMGLCNLRHLEGEIQRRGAAVRRYREHLSGVPGLQVCGEQEGVTSNYSYFPIVVDPQVFGESRDQLGQRLAEHEIITRKYFYPLTSAFECYQGRFPVQKTPVAERISNQVLTLPLYGELTISQVDEICRVILEGKK